jgi:hypothetical protein
MAEILEPLRPIAEIVGANGVKAEYSDTQFFRNGAYQPGWKVTVNANYAGAHLSFSNRALSLQDAAAITLTQLKTALGMS